MTPSTGSHSSPHLSAHPPDAKARDRRVVEAMETALAGKVNTSTTYVTRWRSFARWCDAMGLIPLPAAPDTVVRYLEAHADSGFSFATLRLTASVITKAHDLDGHRSPCKDERVKQALKRLQFRLGKPRAKVEALTRDTCFRISRWARDPRNRGRGQETPAQAERRGRCDVALAYALSEAGLSASEASELTWGDVRHWDDGSGRITVPGSLTGDWTQEAVVAVTGETMDALDAMRPSNAAGDGRVFDLSPSQIVRRVRAAAKAGGIDNWEAFNGGSGRAGLFIRLAENGAPDHVVERQGRRMQANGIVGRYTSGECAAEALPYL